MRAPLLTGSAGRRCIVLTFVVTAASAGLALAASPALVDLPTLDLSLTGDGARQQLVERRSRVEELLAATNTASAELADAFVDLGLLYVVYDFVQPASACFENVRRLVPEDLRGHYLAAYAFGLQGRVDDSSRLYRRALELAPDYLPAAVRLGRIELSAGRLEEAKTAFERALELDPRSAAAHEGLGKIMAARGEHSAAVESFEKALALDPEADRLHYSLAQSQRQLRQLEKARSHLAQAGDVPTRVPDPLIDPLASLAQSAQFYIVQGGEAVEDRDYATAAAAFRSAIDQDAGSFAAYRGLGLSLERLGDRDGARRAYRDALQHGATGDAGKDARERAGIQRSLGLLESVAGRTAEALGHYQASLALRPDQPDLLLRSANALARARRFEEAIAHYDRLIELAPEWTSAVLEKRATAWVNLGRKDEAIADFKGALQATPNDVGLLTRYAAALDFLGDEAAAAQVRRDLAKLEVPAAERLPLLLAEARRRVAGGNFAAATETYREALRLDATHLEARLGLATVLGHVGRFGEAANEFGHILESTPRHLPARRGRIVALVLGGNFAAARQELQEALKTFPRHLGFALTQVRLLTLAPDDSVHDGALALAVAQRVHAEDSSPRVEELLAVAYAAAGRFDDATTLQRRLVDAAQSLGDQQTVNRRKQRLDDFVARRPAAVGTARDILADLELGQGGAA